ncbi:MAG: hypothetical protein NZ891_05150, partial [bacterium]|nr:hypothetical protein [bacterium]MDW8164111.1 hypothetical protein [Candidatus Omnitrophota bacterium]
LKSSEIIDEILNEIKKVEKDKIIPPIKIGEKWIVVYLKDKKQLEINKIEKYKEIKEKLFKTKYSILYRNYIETLSNTIPIKFL